MNLADDVLLHLFGQQGGIAAGGGVYVKEIILERAVDLGVEGLLHIEADILADLAVVAALPLVVALEDMSHELVHQLIDRQTVDGLVQTGLNIPQLQNPSGVGGGRGGGGAAEIVDVLGKGLLQVVQQLEQGDKIGVVELVQAASEGTEGGNGIHQLYHAVIQQIEVGNALFIELIVFLVALMVKIDAALYGVVHGAVFGIEVELLGLQLFLGLLDGAVQSGHHVIAGVIEEAGGVVGAVFRVHAQLIELAEDLAGEGVGSDLFKVEDGQRGVEGRAVLLPLAAALIPPGVARRDPALGCMASGDDALRGQDLQVDIGEHQGIATLDHFIIHLIGGEAQLTYPVIHHIFGDDRRFPADALLEAAVEAGGQIGGDLSHGDLGVGGAQHMIGEVGAVPAGESGHALSHIGQVATHGETAVLFTGGDAAQIHVRQIGHDIVGGHMDAVAEAVGQDGAVRLGGRDEVAEVHRRLLGIHRESAVVLLEEIVARLQVHEIVQLLHGGVAVGVVIGHTGGVGGYLRLGGHHVGQEEEAHDIARRSPALVLQGLTHDVAGVQETARAGTTRDTGEDVDVQGRGVQTAQGGGTLLFDSGFEGGGLAQKEVASHLPDAAGALGREEAVDFIDLHPVEQGIFADDVLAA